jgi:hypothetical protein
MGVSVGYERFNHIANIVAVLLLLLIWLSPSNWLASVGRVFVGE